MSPALLTALADLKRRREQLDAATAERNVRSERALRWLAENKSRSLGAAWAYVGAEAAQDDEENARAAFMAAADAVVAAARAQINEGP